MYNGDAVGISSDLLGGHSLRSFNTNTRTHKMKHECCLFVNHVNKNDVINIQGFGEQTKKQK